MSLPATLDTTPQPPANHRPSLLEAWLGDKSRATRQAYRRDLEHFASWFDPTGSPSGVRLERFLAYSAGAANEVALRYRTALLTAGLASATVSRRLAALKSFVKLARTLGLVAWSIEVARPRPEARQDRSGPDPTERRKLWKAIRRDDSIRGRRDRAIVALLFDLALRRAEVAALDLADVDPRAGTVAVLRKGRREKVRLRLPRQTRADVDAWTTVRGPEPGALFHRLDRPLGTRGPLSGEAIRLIVDRLARAAGIGRRVRPHGLRHAGITAAADLRKSPIDLREFAGHAKMETTMAYIDRPGEKAFGVAESVARERGR